jgi:hypothetical protein
MDAVLVVRGEEAAECSDDELSEKRAREGGRKGGREGEGEMGWGGGGEREKEREKKVVVVGGFERERLRARVREGARERVTKKLFET